MISFPKVGEAVGLGEEDKIDIVVKWVRKDSGSQPALVARESPEPMGLLRFPASTPQIHDSAITIAHTPFDAILPKLLYHKQAYDLAQKTL